MTALEKAAKAAYDETNRQVGGRMLPWEDMNEPARESVRLATRAVLMAVLELDDAVVLVGCREIEDAPDGEQPWTGPYDIWKPAARKSFVAMIDAILAEPTA